MAIVWTDRGVDINLHVHLMAIVFPLLILAYVVYAISSGKIVGGSHGSVTVYRDERPVSFWIIVVIDLGFAVFLFLVLRQ
jgi:hypothetical protein